MCLQLKVHADCDRISVLYWDDDDDVIPINSQDELSEAFKVGNCFVYLAVTFYSVKIVISEMQPVSGNNDMNA